MHIRLATAADMAAIANLEQEQYAAEGYPAAFFFDYLGIGEHRDILCLNYTA